MVRSETGVKVHVTTRQDLVISSSQSGTRFHFPFSVSGSPSSLLHKDHGNVGRLVSRDYTNKTFVHYKVQIKSFSIGILKRTINSFYGKEKDILPLSPLTPKTLRKVETVGSKLPRTYGGALDSQQREVKLTHFGTVFSSRLNAHTRKGQKPRSRLILGRVPLLNRGRSPGQT